MTLPIESLTTAALSLALDAASQRHQLIAANIANANAQGYTPLRLAFEEHLAEAQGALREQGSVDAFALSSVRMTVEPAIGADGQPAAVQLDVEVAEMARNAVHYQALTQGLSRHLSIMAMAAGDGKK
ncbi:MAG TPA: flagellar basal body protein [Ramlibacter sp.]|nr:flagellar basal body protein [Ramlibacter sp.]